MIEIWQSTRPAEIYSYFIYKDLNFFLAIAAAVELEYQAETIRLCLLVILCCVLLFFLWIHLAEMTFIDKYTVRIHIGFYFFNTVLNFLLGLTADWVRWSPGCV